MLTLAAILAVAIAIALRVRWNNVPRYSPADETVMLGHARAVLLRGFSYRAYCEAWLGEPRSYCTPGPVRFGNLYMLALAFRLTGRWKHRTMAWVSTLWGAVHVAAVYGIATELVSHEAGLFAAVLAGVSPLGLAMGRRALQDSALSATALAATWALLVGSPAAAGLLLAFLLAQKETAALFFPAVAAVALASGVPLLDVAIGCAGGVTGYVLAFAALTRTDGVRLLWRFARAVSSVGDHPYSTRYQSGPLHRLPLDLLALGPVACLLAARSDAYPALAGAATLLLVLGLVPATKNARLALPADGWLRVAAGAALASWSLPAALGALALSVAADLWIFRRVFLREGVYDPVSANVLTALGIVPKERFADPVPVPAPSIPKAA